MGLFSISASTKLVNIFSASSSWGWTTGSSSTALSGVQSGWVGGLMHSMGLSSGSAGTATISAGEYVVGFIVNVSASATAAAGAGGSNMTMYLYGAVPTGGVGFQTAGAMSSAGLSVGSFIGTSGSVAAISNAGTAVLSHISATATAASTVGLLINAGTVAFARIQTSTSSSQTTSLTAWSAAPTGFSIAGVGTTAELSTGQFTGFTVAPTAANALSSGGLAAVSAFTGSGSMSAITSVFVIGAPNFSFQGTGSTYSSVTPNNFICGIMATAAMPAAITLSSTAVTLTGTVASYQPWFAIAGS